LPADSTDQYIIAQATALGNDQNRIFAFVRDQIWLDVYMGSVRGARGTLWSQAGNSLDKSSLLIALLGAAGISATYVQGTLTSAQRQQLILSMFQNSTQVVGCPPLSILNSPQSDATLTYDLTNHYWVQVGGLALDPSFAGATPGQVFGTSPTTFAVPDD
jgi:transglutaminase-like putative cysteine protease